MPTDGTHEVFAASDTPVSEDAPTVAERRRARAYCLGGVVGCGVVLWFVWPYMLLMSIAVVLTVGDAIHDLRNTEIRRGDATVEWLPASATQISRFVHTDTTGYRTEYIGCTLPRADFDALAARRRWTMTPARNARIDSDSRLYFPRVVARALVDERRGRAIVVYDLDREWLYVDLSPPVAR